MATIAVGDIHGNLSALNDLLAEILPELNGGDTLVFLGDYIDRGPDSRGCIEKIIKLQHSADFEVVTLMGNHEQWMLRSLHDPWTHSWIVGMEAFETIESYSPNAARILAKALEEGGIDVILKKRPLPYHVFIDSLPAEHLDFFSRLQLFHRSPDVISAHGGVDLEGHLHSQDPDVYVWGLSGFPEDYRGNDPVVYGHRNDAVEDATGRPMPVMRENRAYGIDTIEKGVLTALRFPDLQVFQSKR